MLTGPLPKQIDYRKLADQLASLDGCIAIEEFKRLPDLLVESTGELVLSLKFSRGKRRLPLVTGNCTGEVLMTCQVCLEPVPVKVEAVIRSLLVDNVEVLVTLDLDDDGLVCDGVRVDLVDLVEDDIIVSLPMVPKHAPDSCTAAFASSPAETGEQGTASTHKPFAGLAELRDQFKRSE